MKFNLLLVGAGYFAQRVHLRYLKLNSNIKDIYIFDERQELAKKVAKKIKITNLPEINKDIIKQKKISICLVCFNRDKSYHYSKMALNYDLHLLSEKPVTYNKKNLLKLIKLSKRKKKLFSICYQKIHHLNILHFKKNIENFKKYYGKITKVNFELFNGDMRCGTKSFCRTKEKLNNKNIEKLDSLIPSKISTNYKVFLNRYIHSINLFYHLFGNKNKNRIKYFSINSLYDYNLIINNQKIDYIFSFGNYNFSKWHDRIIIFFERGKITIDLNAPLNFKNSLIKIYNGNKKTNNIIKFRTHNVFEDQFNLFLSNIKNKNLISFSDEKKYISDYTISQIIWRFLK